MIYTIVFTQSVNRLKTKASEPLIPFFSVENLEELKRQSEKERDAKCDEAAKEVNRVKLNVESRRQELEARQKNVETVVGEVCFSFIAHPVSIS